MFCVFIKNGLYNDIVILRMFGKLYFVFLIWFYNGVNLMCDESSL